MNHKGTKILKTERLTLRPFEESDAEAMFENWANDPEVTKFLTWAPHGSVEVTRETLRVWCEKYAFPDAYNWAIEFQEQVMGNISVIQIKERNEECCIGYCMSRKFWGKGIMTEAFRAVLTFLFEEVGAHRVWACHDKNNPASGKVMQKCGLLYEGTARQRSRVASTGEWDDILYYAILRDEYFKERR